MKTIFYASIIVVVLMIGSLFFPVTVHFPAQEHAIMYGYPVPFVVQDSDYGMVTLFGGAVPYRIWMVGITDPATQIVWRNAALSFFSLLAGMLLILHSLGKIHIEHLKRTRWDNDEE